MRTQNKNIGATEEQYITGYKRYIEKIVHF
jgi:hypothetical protein